MDESTVPAPLLLELARDAFTKQIAKRVRPLSRGFVERWMACELWLYPAVIQRHRVELHLFRDAVIEVLKNTTLEEMLNVCNKTRPDLSDLWGQPAARKKLSKEIEKSIEAVGSL